MAKEKAAWQAFKDKKADDFKKVVSTRHGRRLRRRNHEHGRQEMDGMRKTDDEIVCLQRFQRHHADDADTAIVTYKAKSKAAWTAKIFRHLQLRPGLADGKGRMEGGFPHRHRKRKPAAARN